MSDKLIIGRVTPLQPSIGPGNTPMCARCIRKMEHDQGIEHQIVEILKTKSFPHEITDGKNAWAEIIDLLKLREAQYGK